MSYILSIPVPDDGSDSTHADTIQNSIRVARVVPIRRRLFHLEIWSENK